MSCHRSYVASFIAVIVLSSVSPFILWESRASAQVPFDIVVSIKGGVNFSGIDKPDDKTYHGIPTNMTYPGFFDVGGGVGLFVEPRLFDMVGIEIGMVYEASSGSGDLNDEPITLYSNDLVFPIHVRLITPGSISFIASLGVDLVVPLSTDVEKSALIISPIEALEREVTTYLGFAIGLSIDLGVISIPIEFWGRYAPGVEDNYDARVDIDSQDASGNMIWKLKTDWPLQGGLSVGVAYSFDIL